MILPALSLLILTVLIPKMQADQAAWRKRDAS